MKKRILSMMLCMLLLCSLFPAKALAWDMGIPSLVLSVGNEEIIPGTYYLYNKDATSNKLTSTDANKDNFNIYASTEGNEVILNNAELDAVLHIPGNSTVIARGKNKMLGGTAVYDGIQVQTAGKVTIKGERSEDNAPAEIFFHLEGGRNWFVSNSGLDLIGDLTVTGDYGGAIYIKDGNLRIEDNVTINTQDINNSGTSFISVNNKNGSGGNITIGGNSKITAKISSTGISSSGGDILFKDDCQVNVQSSNIAITVSNPDNPGKLELKDNARVIATAPYAVSVSKDGTAIIGKGTSLTASASNTAVEVGTNGDDLETSAQLKVAGTLNILSAQHGIGMKARRNALLIDNGTIDINAKTLGIVISDPQITELPNTNNVIHVKDGSVKISETLIAIQPYSADSICFENSNFEINNSQYGIYPIDTIPTMVYNNCRTLTADFDYDKLNSTERFPQPVSMPPNIMKNFTPYVFAFSSNLKLNPAMHNIENGVCKNCGKATFNVTFDSHGGSSMKSLTNIIEHDKILQPETPTKDGENFVGWYKDEAYTEPWDFNTDTVTEDITLHAKWTKENVLKLYGTIMTENDKNNNNVTPISGATVTLKKGNETVQTVTTNDVGYYSFIGIKAGIYNLITTKDGKTVTALITISEDTSENNDTEFNITIPKSNISSEVDIQTSSDEEVPALAVGGLDDIAKTEAESLGTDVTAVKYKVTIKRQEISENQTDSDDNNKENDNDNTTQTEQLAISEKAGNKKLQFLDIKIDKTEVKKAVDSSDENITTTPITDTHTALEIVIPFDFSGKKNVKVYRYHDNTATEFTEATNTNRQDATFRLDQDRGLIYIYAQMFSTYAIGYEIKSNNTGGGFISYYPMLSFETNGGNTIENVSTHYGSTIDLTLEQYLPTREGYTFSGWYADQQLREKITSIYMNGNKKIYADWTKNEESEDIITDKQEQEITVPKDKITKRYGAKAFNLGAKANTELSYKSNNNKVVTVDEQGKVRIKGAGNAKITIRAAESDTYKAAEKTVTIKVNKAKQTIKIKKNAKIIKRSAVAKKSRTYTFTTTGKKTALKAVKLTKAQKKAIKSVKISGNKVKVTVKKGAKKGTYKLKVYAVQGKNYKASAKKVITLKVTTGSIKI